MESKRSRLDTVTGDRPDPRGFPEDRKKPTEEATMDTLYSEIVTVADRHSADLSNAEIVQALIDVADTWAMMEDVELGVEHVERPEGGPGAIVHFTGPRADDVEPSSIGKFYPDEVEELADTQGEFDE